ncbi:CSS-motif domain-containing protein [Jiella pelagia]|uniref:CSS-motif domain-containing protein n=1 Tax=Jiella pelagia TaxID=2986949 RepID=A0ABY7C4I5_9HYPH|nr:CSS-motif domain-containing protein [Jiella pelagia]WAP69688.1 CSS-motif domain-containing protein [Jiella pelagia]
MARSIVNLVSRKRQQVVVFVGGLLTFILLLVLVAWFAQHVTDAVLVGETRQLLQPLDDRRDSIYTALNLLEKNANAEPCSPLFHKQMQRIALLPDGLHEFAYVGNEGIACSVTQGRLSSPMPLGEPDTVFSGRGDEVQFWGARDLTGLGFSGLVGSVIKRGRFAVLYPKPQGDLRAPDWLVYEWGMTDVSGRYWSRGSCPRGWCMSADLRRSPRLIRLPRRAV